jgi:hypothetical protein
MYLFSRWYPEQLDQMSEKLALHLEVQQDTMAWTIGSDFLLVKHHWKVQSNPIFHLNEAISKAIEKSSKKWLVYMKPHEIWLNLPRGESNTN